MGDMTTNWILILFYSKISGGVRPTWMKTNFLFWEKWKCALTNCLARTQYALSVEDEYPKTGMRGWREGGKRGTTFLRFLKSANMETQRETSRETYRRWEILRGRTRSWSLPYFRYLTCPFMNIMDISVFHFTMKTLRPCEGTERSQSWAFAQLDVTPGPACMEARASLHAISPLVLGQEEEMEGHRRYLKRNALHSSIYLLFLLYLQISVRFLMVAALLKFF